MVDVEAVQFSVRGCAVFGLCDVGSGFGCRGKIT